jgi:surface antigen
MRKASPLLPSLFRRPRIGRLLIVSATLSAAVLPTAQAMALNEGLQCVPYARQVSGVQIFGDAHTWWGQAQGKYGTGRTPKFGAVLAFKPHGKMQLGHVGAVSKILDNRTILMSHANWSTINGKRGHIENNVQVVDVSERNDWSRVRVWYTPIGALGTTEWPTHGFIYPDKAPRSMPPAGSPVQYAAKPVPKAAPKPAPVMTAQAPEPKKLAQQVTPKPVPAPTPARVSYAPSASAAAPAPVRQEQRPLRDYNAAPQNYGQPTYQASYQHPRQQPVQRPQQSAARANQPLPKGYTPSVTADGVRPQGPQSMDDLLAGI